MKTVIVSLLVAWLGFTPFAAFAAHTAEHAVHSDAACAKDPALCNSQSIFARDGLVHDVANTLIFLVGAISVIYVIIGGLKYTLSTGDPKSIQAAKDTIMYAIVGAVVALLAGALVNFVVFKVSGGTP